MKIAARVLVFVLLAVAGVGSRHAGICIAGAALLLSGLLVMAALRSSFERFVFDGRADQGASDKHWHNI